MAQNMAQRCAWLSTMLLIGGNFFISGTALAQSCSKEFCRQEFYSMTANMKLNAASYQIIETVSQLSCIHHCMAANICKSANVKMLSESVVKCELFSVTAASSGTLIDAQDWQHYELRESPKQKIKEQKPSYYESCDAALKDNGNQPNTYMIKPAGSDIAYNISCRYQGGQAWTIFSHDKEHEVFVSGYYGNAKTTQALSYNISMAVMVNFVNLAVSCRQFTYARCFSSSFVFRGYCYLNDRNNNKLSFWGGGPSNGRGCACSIASDCVSSDYGCNCDVKDNQWRSDQGYITQKSILPITSFTLGDVHQIYYKIGKLECIHS